MATLSNDELNAAVTGLRHEFTRLELEHRMLARESSPVQLRNHAKRLLDHIARTHAVLAVLAGTERDDHSQR